MLQRLNEGHVNVPMALETARMEQQIREDTERELREQRPDEKSNAENTAT